MKKYLFLITLILGGLCSKSQDLKLIKNQIMLKQYDQAKPELDAFLNDPKNASNAEAWYYKAYVHNALGRVPANPVKESKTLYQSAFDAVKKYAEVDPKQPLTTEEKNSTLFNIYYGFYDLGVKTYNDKNFTESYELFKKSLEVHDYIHDKKLTGANDLKFSAHDTDLVWNIVILANEIKRKDDAMIYYKKIADADLPDEKYAFVYDEIILKYKREKNAELFKKYLASAKRHYPVDKPYWEAQEIEFSLKGLENEALLKQYETLTKTLPDNYNVFYNYGVEIDKFTGTDAAKGKDIAAYRKKMEDLFKKAITIKSTVEANLQLANIYYNKTFDLQEQIAKIKGTKPEEVKLKNELTAQNKSLMNATIPYAEEAVRLLKALPEYKLADKINYRLAVEILTAAYMMAGNAAKVAEYEKKKIDIDNM